MSMRMRVQSLASFSGLRIRHCHKLQCRSQMRLGSSIAVAVAKAGRCSYDLTPSPGASIRRRCGHERKKEKREGGREEGRKKERREGRGGGERNSGEGGGKDHVRTPQEDRHL